MTRKDRRRKVTPQMKGRMKKLRDEGLTYQKIAERLNLSYATVYNHLKKKEREKEKVTFPERLVRKIAPISIAVVVLIIAIVGYYFLTSEEVSEVEYETYVNENYSFKFDYPADWTFEKMRLPWSSTFIFMDAPENERGIWLVVIEEVGVENQFRLSLDNIRSVISNPENIPEDLENLMGWRISNPIKITIDNTPALRSLAISAPTENITLRCQIELAVKDNYLYLFAVVTKEEKYSEYEQIFEHVIDSFTFLEN